MLFVLSTAISTTWHHLEWSGAYSHSELRSSEVKSQAKYNELFGTAILCLLVGHVTSTLGMCGTLILFPFSFSQKKTLIRFRMSSVQFEKTLFGSDIVDIYYLCNTWVANLQQILQRYCAVLNELCTPYWLWYCSNCNNCSNVILSLLIWTADCTQFLSENCLQCQILDGLDFSYRNRNQFRFSAHSYLTWPWASWLFPVYIWIKKTQISYIQSALLMICTDHVGRSTYILQRT